MDFLTLDKIFVLDNLNIVLDKKYFVQADGRGISFPFFAESHNLPWKFWEKLKKDAKPLQGSNLATWKRKYSGAGL